jgi:hypothetical protein
MRLLSRCKKCKKKSKRRAQAYVEFIVVLPGVLLLTFLTWEFAYFWWGRMVTSTATFEAGRQVAAGEPISTGYAAYDYIVGENLAGMGGIESSDDGYVYIDEWAPMAYRSVAVQSNVPWHWPSGLATLTGDYDMSMKSKAFFRREEFYPGPPDMFE